MKTWKILHEPIKNRVKKRFNPNLVIKTFLCTSLAQFLTRVVKPKGKCMYNEFKDIKAAGNRKLRRGVKSNGKRFGSTVNKFDPLGEVFNTCCV
jgi:hypothetical protein